MWEYDGRVVNNGCVIAVVDGDPHIGGMLDEVLSGAGYVVTHAYSGTEALYLLREHRPDLVLLDLMMPGLAGEDVLPHITGVPVIVMSAKGDIDSKVGMLGSGAVDYVTKPFDTRELLARIAVQLRLAEGIGRNGAAGTGAGVSSESGNGEGDGRGMLTVGDLTLDRESHEVVAAGSRMRLTPTEYAILLTLMFNSRQVVTRSALLDRVHESTPDCTEGTLKIHVSNLRGKLREATGRNCVEAVWGIGFKLASPQACPDHI